MALVAIPARAALKSRRTAKLAQNPAGNLISLPFHTNTNFDFGQQNGTQNSPRHPIRENDRFRDFRNQQSKVYSNDDD